MSASCRSSGKLNVDVDSIKRILMRVRCAVFDYFNKTAAVVRLSAFKINADVIYYPLRAY